MVLVTRFSSHWNGIEHEEQSYDSELVLLGKYVALEADQDLNLGLGTTFGYLWWYGT